MGPTVSVGKSVNLVGQCTKHELFFPKNTFFILQFCLAPFFNFFPLGDLKYNLPQISGKIRFFSGKYRIFPIFRRKIDDFLDFLPIFLLPIFFFFLSKSFPCRPKTDFSLINQPKKPIFCSLLITFPPHPQWV